jgi:hypothetical protein
MRRETLKRALSNVFSAIEASQAPNVFRYLSGPRREEKERSFPPEFYRDALEGYSKFMNAFGAFGPEERKILGIFELETLAVPDVWLTPIRVEGSKPTLYGRLRYVVETFPRFSMLLERGSDEEEIALRPAQKGSSTVFPTKRLTFFIRELETPTLTLRDFASIIGDIETIFQAVLKVSGEKGSDLVVVALDSGSEKSIDVVGIASAVDKLSGFMLEVWDRIRFARANKVRASIKTASEGLTLLNELRVSQEKGAVTPEEAEKLKRVLLKSVDDLFVKGVYTDEMQQSVPLQPRELQFQRTKLIAHYSSASPTDTGPSPSSDYKDEDMRSEE